MKILEAFRQTGSIRGASRLSGVPESTIRGWRKEKSFREWSDRAMREHKEANKNTITHRDTTKNSYVYSKQTDTYIFHLTRREDPYKIPGDTFRQICWDYPRKGANKTRGQIAIEYGMPLPILEIILRTYGLYKHNPPYANEDFEEASDEERVQMVEDTIEKRKHNWLVDLDKREHQALLNEVKSLRAYKANRQSAESRLEESAQRVFQKIGPAPPLVQSVEFAGGYYDGEQFAVHAPMADLHGGMFAWGAETWGENFDTKIAAAIDVQHANEVARFVGKLGGHCYELWSTNIGDHFNGLDLETMHGTPQEQDGRAFKVWELMFEAAVKKVEILRQVCALLRIRFIPGNHDHIHLQHFFHSLQQRYYYADDVEIVWHPRWQESFTVNKSLHTLDHGQGFPRDVGSDKAISMAKRVVRNAGGDHYYETRFHYLYLGHLHNEGRAEDDNLKVYRLPAGADQTDWENRNRWTAEPSARVWTLDELGRPEIERPLYFRRGQV